MESALAVFHNPSCYQGRLWAGRRRAPQKQAFSLKKKNSRPFARAAVSKVRDVLRGCVFDGIDHPSLPGR